MSCCTPTIVPFSNVATSSISYPAALQIAHGAIPRVQVIYYNEETGDFDLSIDATKVALVGTPVNEIFIDHGGPNSGYVKIV